MASTIRVPTSAAESLASWNAVLTELEARRKFSLLGWFQHARVMRWTPEQIELGFPVDVHSMGEMASEAKTLDELRLVLKELGPELAQIKPTIRMLDERESSAAGVRSVLETTRDRSKEERTTREAEAREHPMTKHVLQTFGAQIKEIKTDV